jgi:hypothetical protein
VGSQLTGDAGLAYSGLTGQHNQPAAASHGVVQGSVELGHLLMPANEQPVCLSGTGHGLPIT